MDCFKEVSSLHHYSTWREQPKPVEWEKFMYGGDLYITTQQKDFTLVENGIEPALIGMTKYYQLNYRKPNPTKTQIPAFIVKLDASSESSGMGNYCISIPSTWVSPLTLTERCHTKNVFTSSRSLYCGSARSSY